MPRVAIGLVAALGLIGAGCVRKPEELGSKRVQDAHAQVQLIAPVRAVHPGEEFNLEILFRIDPGWHIYGQDPGDAGMPTQVTWKLPKGVTAGPIEWPEPKEFRQGPIVTSGYEGEVVLTVPVRGVSVQSRQPLNIRASVRWLSCQEECIPGKADLDVALPIRKGKAL